ncbi:integrase arm-type DNA-binding domain-containing protein [Marinobacter salinisoli]|uniref:Integrase arm-type DNA-binding domain-containing protein n=1 Tax=Marinobacter salinisoli TaxID=2769486 RepID=A0ABX7MNG6_9GAMM|nr:site-specific integrase [Marinobacter salinisoli]QSP93802.1 integrase arm-type DNA-binding domain-containing protein [Marinobacter salinisoli]
MPKKVRELSATEVRRLTHAVSKTSGKAYNALHPVGGVSGLLLQVTPSNAKSWIYRTVIAGKRRSIGLGAFPDVTLAQARDKARETRDKITAGIDPVEEKNANKRALLAARLSTVTFVDAMSDYIDMKSKEFKNPRQRQQWENSLNTYAVPHIGKVPVREIALPHVKAVLDPIWYEKTETANRVRARMENILGWCAIHGYRSNENPAKWQGYLDEVYPSPEKIKKKAHFNALPVEAMPDFMAALKKRTGTAARALEFLVLTAARTNEVIGDKRIHKAGVTWQEVDLKSKVWTVPAQRMKSGKEHRVPLSETAVNLLKDMPPGEPNQLIFPGPKGDIPSNNFLTALLKRMEIESTIHGFRSTFKDWARECTSYADEVSELALAHVNSDATRAAYARSELIDKRRLLMADWEKFCTEGEKAQENPKVISISGGVG